MNLKTLRISGLCMLVLGPDLRCTYPTACHCESLMCRNWFDNLQLLWLRTLSCLWSQKGEGINITFALLLFFWLLPLVTYNLCLMLPCRGAALDICILKGCRLLPCLWLLTQLSCMWQAFCLLTYITSEYKNWTGTGLQTQNQTKTDVIITVQLVDTKQ